MKITKKYYLEMSQSPDLASHSSGLTEEGHISVEKGGTLMSRKQILCNIQLCIYFVCLNSKIWEKLEFPLQRKSNNIIKCVVTETDKTQEKIKRKGEQDQFDTKT